MGTKIAIGIIFGILILLIIIIWKLERRILRLEDNADMMMYTIKAISEGKPVKIVSSDELEDM
jgi:hypothetical protein